LLAGTIDPSVPDHKYLEYAKGFPCVIQIEGRCLCGQGEEHMFYGSAVAISPKWVLTAAHVVDGNDRVCVRIGEDAYKALKVIVHGEFKRDRIGYSDIAICHMDKNLGLNFYPELYDSDDEVSKVVSMAGYGMTGNFRTGYTGSDGKKRAGSNIIAKEEHDVLICVLTDRKTQLEFLIAPGDSGGGMFIGNKLAGINSFITAPKGKPNSSYENECAHTRISKFAPWIRGVMKKYELQEVDE
jgi:secreted trypsin-like serine protease